MDIPGHSPATPRGGFPGSLVALRPRPPQPPVLPWGARGGLGFWELTLAPPPMSCSLTGGTSTCRTHPVGYSRYPLLLRSGARSLEEVRGFEEPGKGLETNILGQVSWGTAGKPLGLGCLAPNLTSDLRPGAPAPGLGWRTPDCPPVLLPTPPTPNTWDLLWPLLRALGPRPEQRQGLVFTAELSWAQCVNSQVELSS